MPAFTFLLALAAGSLHGDVNAQVQQQATAPTPDMIVFRSDRDIYDGDIYRMDHHGTHLQRLTSNRGTEKSIAVNVQGTQIAFFRDVGYGLGVKGLYTVRSDGTGERLLMPMLDCGTIAFSPDGSQLAFVNVDYAIGPQNEIYLINADGSHLRRFTDHAYANYLGLAWSRDASTLAFMRYQTTPGVFYVPTAGGPSSKIVSGEEPGFSLRGDKLIYSRSINGLKRVYWSDVQGRTEREILEGYDIGRVVFDVDGTSVVFSAYRPKQQVFIMDAGLHVTNLSNNRFSDSGPVVAGS